MHEPGQRVLGGHADTAFDESVSKRLVTKLYNTKIDAELDRSLVHGLRSLATG